MKIELYRKSDGLSSWWVATITDISCQNSEEVAKLLDGMLEHNKEQSKKFAEENV